MNWTEHNRVRKIKRDAFLRRDELNTLAVESKTEKVAELKLWYEVEQFSDWVVKRYCQPGMSASVAGVLDKDDFYQVAYIGFLNAVRIFDPDKSSFLTILNRRIRSACYEEYTRIGKKSPDTVSIDVPIRAGGDESGSIIDFIPDEAAEIAFETLLIEDIARAILAEARSLPNLLQSRIIFECVYGGRTLESLATETGTTKQNIEYNKNKAIEYIRRRPIIQAIKKDFFSKCRKSKWDSMTDPYITKGIKAFHSSHQSAVEDIILRMGITPKECKE